MRLIGFFALLLLSMEAGAQYNGPAVEACRAYAKRETGKEVAFDRDTELVIERYTKKVGGQFVSSILTGNGAVVIDKAPSAELSFVCLLADEKRPVFFYWVPRANTSAMQQCQRSEGVRAQPRPCLEYLLQVAEMDLGQLYAAQFQDARGRDLKAGNDDSIAAYRKSNDEWRQYRDAECARQRALAPAGIAPDDYHLACIVSLTRRRGLDMR